jgi:hypothetical protein
MLSFYPDEGPLRRELAAAVAALVATSRPMMQALLRSQWDHWGAAKLEGMSCAIVRLP